MEDEELSPAARDTQAPVSGRAGDSGVGEIPQVPRNVRPAEELSEPALVRGDPEQARDTLFVDQSLRRFALLQSTFVVVLLLIAASLLSLWLFVEIVNVVATIRTFPTIPQVALWTILGLILLALAYAVGRVAVGLARLRKGRQVRYTRVKYLQNATYGVDELRRAKLELEDFCQWLGRVNLVRLE